MKETTNQVTYDDRFQDFYKYKPLMIKIIHNSGVCRRTKQDVNDMLQEIYCKVWLNIAKYNPDKSSVRTYLMSVALSVINNTYKSVNVKKRKEEIYTISLSTELADEVQMEEVIVDESAVDPMDKVESENMIHCLMSDLPLNEREIMYKRFFENKSMEQIGKELMNKNGKQKVSRQWVHQVICKVCTQFAEKHKNVVI